MAVINLKKTCGGGRANHRDIGQFAQRDADFIRQEIEIIAPEVIVCGGTLNEFRTYIFPQLIPVKSFPNCCFFLPGLTTPKGGSTLVIGHYHPSARKNDQLLFDKLVDNFLQNLPFTEGVQRDERTSQIDKEIGEERSERAGVATPRQQFWTELLEKAKDKTPLYAHVRPNGDKDLIASTGLPGVTFVYALRPTESAVRLDVDLTADGKNFQLYEQLCESKHAIETAFGGKLAWSPLRGPNLQKSIWQYVFRPKTFPSKTGSYLDLDQEKWGDIQDAMIESMVRLIKALKPHLEDLSQQDKPETQ